jgi:hypothetical protein
MLKEMRFEIPKGYTAKEPVTKVLKNGNITVTIKIEKK